MDNEQLPNPGEALTVDGHNIDPQTGIAHSPYVEVASNSDIISSLTRSRKTLAELPAPPQEMNTVAVVLYYHLAGVADADISEATGLDVTTIRDVKALDSYKDAMEQLVTQALEFEKGTVRGMLEAEARSSVNRMTSLAKEKQGKALGFAADKEILDRAGYTPKTIVEHKHKMETGLTINLIKKDQTKVVPTIDITPNEEIIHDV